ncbi:hypothetical protein MtrunA17_Chr4g0029621 [Medicago truncatula]|uniref:Uncharacterized protein n=1 Tax=Medicago truncatula TaxID=3880 RepID=A0A396I971_MEDTR|nr:hypothetical protein MtrunA17_Chr4g0029621 [Medicago truncatula]
MVNFLPEIVSFINYPPEINKTSRYKHPVSDSNIRSNHNLST